MWTPSKKQKKKMSDSNFDGIHRDEPDCENSEPNLDTVRLLIGRAKGGDAEARSQLARQVQTYLNVMADKKMPNVVRMQHNVSDIVQQTMIQMIQGIGEFRGESTREFYGWLNRIVENESNKAARDVTRQKRDVRRSRSLEGDEVSLRNQGAVDRRPSPRSEMIAQERIDLFERAMGCLNENDATVVRLRSLEERPFKEIAELMGRSVDAVSKRWVRAMAKLQDELERLSGDPKNQ